MAEQIHEYLVVEPEFALLISIPAKLHCLWSGAAWAEGPVYFRDGDFLLFSDIPNNRMIRFVPDHRGCRARPASTGSRPTTPTGTPAISRAGCCRASMAGGGCRGPSMTAGS